MDTKNIKFVSNRPWLNEQSASKPGPIIKTLPEWYRQADRFAINPETGKPWELPDGGGKIPTWKACPAVFDIMGTGYTYKTPCDIEFFHDARGIIQARILDQQHQNFLLDREPLPQFVAPPGYHGKHFAWWADWAVELPEGYSALYSHPFNRFELPFITTNGIVDNDKDHLPGAMPFFFLKGITGILPAGTPYAQILPFKRQHWEAEYVTSLSAEEIATKNRDNSTRFRKPDGGIYQKEVWERRKYQ
ncbi:MAG: hypothetical protein H6978_06970 [Gammaproteobacteria bacterium]|nr:hypothetical protein [Gammaproteobacteria bacterium]